MKRNGTLPSAHDVARLSGVSQAAVSRAFNPGSSIAAHTRDKVLVAAKQLGYRPNLLARSLITGKSGLVGVVIGSPRNPFFLEALDLLSRQMSAAGKHLLVFTEQADEDADALVDALLRFRVDALLMMSATVSATLAQQCRDAGVPVVFFNRRARMVEGFPSVTGANRLGAGCIADHLVAQEYRRPAFIGGSEHSPTSREREDGFIARLAAHGIPAPMKAYGHFDPARAREAARTLLSLPDRPDAIFCANDMMALATIETARFEFGLEVGRAFGVAGFDDIEGASWRSFDLTSYSQPTDAMIRHAVPLLLDPVTASEPAHIVVEGELKARGSTRRTS